MSFPKEMLCMLRMMCLQYRQATCDLLSHPSPLTHHHSGTPKSCCGSCPWKKDNATKTSPVRPLEIRKIFVLHLLNLIGWLRISRKLPLLGLSVRPPTDHLSSPSNFFTENKSHQTKSIRVLPHQLQLLLYQKGIPPILLLIYCASHCLALMY